MEEGAVDLDIGVSVLAQHHAPLDLPVTVLVNAVFDARIPGAEDWAARRAARLAGAITARHAGLAATGMLQVRAMLRAAGGAPIGLELSPEQESAA